MFINYIRDAQSNKFTSSIGSRGVGLYRVARWEKKSANPPARRKSAKKAKQQPEGSETNPIEIDERPRLTTPDLEFDYDRSQLRDPRWTPGRFARPRLRGDEITNEFKSRFDIPNLERPKGVSKNDSLWFKKKTLSDPTEMFHELYVCHQKGPNRSPTYDEAGFQLDWHKVDRWMKPQSYNKKRMVNGINWALSERDRDRDRMFKAFFADGKGPEGPNSYGADDYVKDHVSKDLGIPWHQITPEYGLEWGKRGFPKPLASEWWHPPNKEERKRMNKMHGGCILRKAL